ncbi:MAG: DNA primase [Patescibacteria group bacterium]
MEPKDEIKARLDIADLIGEYLELKPAGQGSFRALCPFHGEKTASFYVSREKAIWHCFGCNKGGDIFSFVMDMEGIDFPEALHLLGKKAGVEIPEFRPKKDTSHESLLLELQEMAGNVYKKIRLDHPLGELARQYIAKREIPPELVDAFQLGAAPDRWDVLVQLLRSRKITDAQLVASGLAKESGRGNLIDRFRNRLMIPLCDAQGHIVGFTGRLLEGEGPKYLNSPETEIYSKRRLLYGLHLAKTAIRTEKCVIVVEGNLDVIASHKAEVKHVVASSGTALTEDHLAILKRLTNSILFSFDADAAGFAAAQRGIRLAQEAGFQISVISIPKEDGKDPDDVVRKNPARWRELVERPIPIMEYYVTRGLDEHDPNTLEGKRGFSHFILEEIAHLTDEIDRSYWLDRLSDIVNIEKTALIAELQKIKPNRKQPVQIDAKQVVALPRPISRFDRTVELLLALALFDEHYLKELFEIYQPLPSSTNRLDRLYNDLKTLYTNAESTESTPKQLFQHLEEKYREETRLEELQALRALYLSFESTFSELTADARREEWNRHRDVLGSIHLDEQRKQMESAIREAERAGDQTLLASLLADYQKFLST